VGTPSYEDAGVKGQADALSAVHRLLGPTFDYPKNVEVLTPFGQYASVLKLSDELAIAICTDGVGSKTIIASMLDRYDTIGFDCIAMNVNDLICVGARPVAMVDYLGVNTLDPRRAEQILAGLAAAAKEAGIAIPGGEIAQLPEVIGSDGRSPGDATAFDLVGTCIGLVHPDELLLGDRIAKGDALIGIAASGLHSNGYTLARQVLLKDAGLKLDEEVRPNTTLGEILIEPTLIYVRAFSALTEVGISLHGLAHITGDGLLNLCRLNDTFGYAIEEFPRPPFVFDLIQEHGGLEDAEMFRVFNMGIGLVAVVTPEEAGAALTAIGSAGFSATRIGTVTDDAGTVTIAERHLVGSLERESFATR